MKDMVCLHIYSLMLLAIADGADTRPLISQSVCEGNSGSKIMRLFCPKTVRTNYDQIRAALPAKNQPTSTTPVPVSTPTSVRATLTTHATRIAPRQRTSITPFVMAPSVSKVDKIPYEEFISKTRPTSERTPEFRAKEETEQEEEEELSWAPRWLAHALLWALAAFLTLLIAIMVCVLWLNLNNKTNEDYRQNSHGSAFWRSQSLVELDLQHRTVIKKMQAMVKKDWIRKQIREGRLPGTADVATKWYFDTNDTTDQLWWDHFLPTFSAGLTAEEMGVVVTMRHLAPIPRAITYAPDSDGGHGFIRISADVHSAPSNPALTSPIYTEIPSTPPPAALPSPNSIDTTPPPPQNSPNRALKARGARRERLPTPPPSPPNSPDPSDDGIIYSVVWQGEPVD